MADKGPNESARGQARAAQAGPPARPARPSHAPAHPAPGRPAPARIWLALLLTAALALPPAGPATAFDQLAFDTPGADPALRDRLRAASLLVTAQAEGTTDGQDVLTAAQAEYGRLLGALYAEGYYSGVITVRLDGREAATIAPLDAPGAIRSVAVTVQPGPRFRFARARIAPLAAGTTLPEGFATGQPAPGALVEEASAAAIDGWRATGHARARVTAERVTADHAAALLTADIGITPGRHVRFGTLSFTGTPGVSPARLAQIAGFPAGRVYSPEELERVTRRLTRTGTFRSVTLTEAETLSSGDQLDVTAALVAAKPRRLGFGAEIESDAGLQLSGYWMHRNLFGGAENLRLDAEITEIGAGYGGADGRLAAEFSRPGTLHPDTTAYARAEINIEQEPDYREDRAELEFGIRQDLTNRVRAEAGLAFQQSRVRDRLGARTYRQLALPTAVEWERRNDPLDATDGFFLRGEAMPFLGFASTGSGARLALDARGYMAADARDRVVFAARVQLGTVLGSTLPETPRDYLFYSGGGGTVRGQPYQALGVQLLRAGPRTGGRNFLGLSGEARLRLTDRIQGVAFYDAGYVSAVDFFDGSGAWHGGAGLGLRYDSGLGPIRLDLAMPAGGTTGDGLQIYVGIGQSF